MTDQNCGKGMRLSAVGYATNTRPGPKIKNKYVGYKYGFYMLVLGDYLNHVFESRLHSNPYKPGVHFMGHRQTVQKQIRYLLLRTYR